MRRNALVYQINVQSGLRRRFISVTPDNSPVVGGRGKRGNIRAAATTAAAVGGTAWPATAAVSSDAPSYLGSLVADVVVAVAVAVVTFSENMTVPMIKQQHRHSQSVTLVGRPGVEGQSEGRRADGGIRWWWWRQGQHQGVHQQSAAANGSAVEQLEQE